MKNGRRIATIVVLLSGGALLAYCGLRIVSRHCYPASVFYDVGKFYTDFSDGTLQVVNLGSTTGKYAFDWSDTNVKGGNFATAPQCGTYDFALLRTYRRFLAPEAIVLITMCPFSNICPKDYPMPRKDRFAKYYALLNERDMTFFSRKEAVKVWLSLNVGHRIWLKGFPSDTSLDDSRGSMQEMRRCTADRLKRSWMKQFNIENLTLPVPDVDEKDLVWNVGVYQRMIDWCISCGFRPVLIFPPPVP